MPLQAPWLIWVITKCRWKVRTCTNNFLYIPQFNLTVNLVAIAAQVLLGEQHPPRLLISRTYNASPIVGRERKARPGIEPGTTPYMRDALPLSYPAPRWRNHQLQHQCSTLLSKNVEVGTASEEFDREVTAHLSEATGESHKEK